MVIQTGLLSSGSNKWCNNEYLNQKPNGWIKLPIKLTRNQGMKNILIAHKKWHSKLFKIYFLTQPKIIKYNGTWN